MPEPSKGIEVSLLHVLDGSDTMGIRTTTSDPGMIRA
jgi:hypothetical protein